MTAEERKRRPVYSGVLRYFPDALLEVAHASWVGNEQHHPGTPLHWDKSKSPDHLEALTRHLARVGETDDDGVPHLAKVAWRALAALQTEIERQHAGRRDVPAWLAYELEPGPTMRIPINDEDRERQQGKF